jgi:hypothetical protein
VAPLAEVLALWRGFYALLGEASATMVALLFVAASVGSGMFSNDRRAPMRVFLSASVVHFGGILAVSLIIQAPIRSEAVLGSLVVAGAVFGLGYYAVTWRDMVRDGLIKRMDMEDSTWYAYLPVATYLMEAATGVGLIRGFALGWPALAVTLGLLMLIAIHNAWDITVWSIGRRDQ